MLRRESRGRPGLVDRLGTGRIVGTFVKLPALETIDLVAASGLDLAIVDLEHSQLSEADALRLVRHAYALALPVVVRIPSCDRGQVNRLLEAGATGLQLSTVRSVPEVEALVAATRYPPGGRRSVSLAHPLAGFGAVPLLDLVSGASPLLIGQIETADTDDSLEDIFRAGLDVAFLGLTDLEVDVGFDPDRLRARVVEVVSAADATGVALGAFAGTAAQILTGARYVALSSDVALLRTALVGVAREAGGEGT
ncbi:MAG: aldolase/citrate lyase family protein [Actinomycetota bacterium]